MNLFHKTGDYILPRKLVDLIENKIWPSGTDYNLQPKMPVERVRSLCTGDDSIFLYAPPLKFVSEDETNRNWAGYNADSIIEPSSLLLIGDFGMGSDSPIAIRYLSDQPGQIYYLEWTERKVNWKLLSSSFEEFCNVLGI